MSLFNDDQQILIKCGGFSTQLAKHVTEPIDGNPLWCSRFDRQNPQAVIRTYLDFLENGADIILTNSYQASVDGYMKHLNLSREESFQLICTSVKLARKACSLYLQNKSIKNNTELRSTAPYVIGSVGPYAAILNDGSEYRGAYKNTVTKETLQEWHRDRLKALCEEGVDGLAVETIPSRLEAESITELLLTEFPSTCFWVSFQCKDEQHLAHGGLFSEAALSIWRMVKAAGAKERCCGIGVNCLHPQLVEPLLKSFTDLLESDDRPPLVVYSNRGETFNLETREWMGSESCTSLDTFVPVWLKLGARIIGGCCRVCAEDIPAIRSAVYKILNPNPKTL